MPFFQLYQELKEEKQIYGGIKWKSGCVWACQIAQAMEMMAMFYILVGV